MVRTIIQLEEAQRDELQKLAEARHVSMAELVRRGVDMVIESETGKGREERKRRGLEAAGRFDSGLADVAERHDQYLASNLEKRR